MSAQDNPLLLMAPHFQSHLIMVNEIASLCVNFLFEDYSFKKIQQYKDMSKAFMNEIGIKIGKMSQTAKEIYTYNLTLYQQAFDEFITSLKGISQDEVSINNATAVYSAMKLLYQILALDENSDNITAAQLLVELAIGNMHVFIRKYTTQFKKMNTDFLEYIPKNTSKILQKVFADFSRIRKFVKENPGRNSIEQIETLVKLWHNAIPFVSIYRCSALVAQMPKGKQASVTGAWTFLNLFEKIGVFYSYAVNMLQYQVSFVIRNLTNSTVSDLERMGMQNVIDRSKMNSLDEFLLMARKQIGHTYTFAGDFHDKLESAISDAKKAQNAARQYAKNPRFQSYANLLSSIILYASNAVKYQEAAMFNFKLQQIAVAGHLSQDGLSDIEAMDKKISKYVEQNATGDILPFVCKASSFINLYLFRIRFIADSETFYTLQRKASNSVSLAAECAFGNERSGAQLVKDIKYIKTNADKLAKKYQSKRIELLSPDFKFKPPIDVGQCTDFKIKIPAAFDYTTIAQGTNLTTEDLSESTGALLSSLSKFMRRRMYYAEPIDIGRLDAGPDDEGADAEVVAEEEDGDEAAGGEEDFNEEEAYAEEDWNEEEPFPDLTRAPETQYDYPPLPPAPQSEFAAFNGAARAPVFVLRGQPVQGVPSQPPPPPAIGQFAGIINPSNVDLSVEVRPPRQNAAPKVDDFVSTLAPPPGVNSFQRSGSESFFSSGGGGGGLPLQHGMSSSSLFTIPEQPGFSAANLPPPPGVGGVPGIPPMPPVSQNSNGGMPQLPGMPPMPNSNGGMPNQPPNGGMPSLPGMPNSNGGMPSLPSNQPPLPGMPPMPSVSQSSNGGMPPLPSMPSVTQNSNGGMPPLPGMPSVSQNSNGGMPPLPGMPSVTQNSNGGMPPLPSMPSIPPANQPPTPVMPPLPSMPPIPPSTPPQVTKGSSGGMPPLSAMPPVPASPAAAAAMPPLPGMPAMPPLPGMPSAPSAGPSGGGGAPPPLPSMPQGVPPSVPGALDLPPPPGIGGPPQAIDLPPPPGIGGAPPALPGIDGLNLPAGLPGLPAGPLKPEQRTLASIRERITDIEAVLANPLVTNENLARVRGYAERMSSEFASIEKTFM